MPAPLTTRPQVSGYRFIIRRMEHALVRRDVRMLHEPLRSAPRALSVGAVLGALILAGFGIVAWLSPAPDTSGADILLAQDSGALYVRVRAERDGAEVLHPALNLASARLVAGAAQDPLRVPDGRLPGLPRGPLVGIPGAPQRIPGGGALVPGPWTVCDVLDHGAVARTVVAAGAADHGDGAGAVVSGDDAVLVTDGDADFVLREGHRHAVDLADPAVVRALGLAGAQPQRVSAGLVAALPEGPALTAPAIDGAGTAPPYPAAGARVGDVLSVSRHGEATLHAVLADGLQEVSPVAADLITFSGAGRGARVREAAAEVLAAAPLAADRLPLDGLPPRALRLRGDAGALCATWRAGDEDGPGGWAVRTAARVPVDGADAAVPLVGADGPGPAADAFVLRQGAAAHVRASGPGDAGGDAGSADGPRFFVDDTGVRYGIPDAATSAVLGLDGAPAPAPWPVLALLPAGPALTRTDAMVMHDGLAPDPAPGILAGGE